MSDLTETEEYNHNLIVEHNETKIVHAISSFIEDYELYEYEYLNPVQLRALYYRMKKEGGLSRFQDQDMSKSKYRTGE